MHARITGNLGLDLEEDKPTVTEFPINVNCAVLSINVLLMIALQFIIRHSSLITDYIIHEITYIQS